MNERIRVLEPTAAPGASRSSLHALDTLVGRTIGFIDNGKPNFNYLVDDLVDLMLSKYGVSSVMKRRKRGPSVPAPSDMVADIVDQCDAVVTGSGD